MRDNIGKCTAGLKSKSKLPQVEAEWSAYLVHSFLIFSMEIHLPPCVQRGVTLLIFRTPKLRSSIAFIELNSIHIKNEDKHFF